MSSSISFSNSRQLFCGGGNSPHSSPLLSCFSFLLPFPTLRISTPARFASLKAATGAQGSQDPALLRRPLVSSPPDNAGEGEEEEDGGVATGISDEDGDGGDDDGVVGRMSVEKGRGSHKSLRREQELVDWEDQILEDTVPLVGFVRMLLHSGKYENGDKLSPEHEKTVLERLLPYHPEFEKKIGCGIDFITIGYHPDFENSRCLFIVRKDGESVDFSYWKCIKGLIRKNYPFYADSFILRHFRRHNKHSG